MNPTNRPSIVHFDELVAGLPADLALLDRAALERLPDEPRTLTNPCTGELSIMAHRSNFTLMAVLGKTLDALTATDRSAYEAYTGNLVQLDGTVVFTSALPADFLRLTPDPAMHPVAGDIIYIKSQGSFDHGEDDVTGGWVRVKHHSLAMSGGLLTCFISTLVVPNRRYNWDVLRQQQNELRARFGQVAAQHSPDYNDYSVPGEWKSSDGRSV